MSPGKSKKGFSDYTDINRVKLVRGGKEYFDLLLNLIECAQESVHVQTYIFANDETGRIVADALINAANRNVQVYLVVDGYASQDIPDLSILRLLKAGIHFRFFEPVLKSKYYYFGRRLHHKLAVIDARYALVGGINISDNYNDLPGKPAWLDFAVYVEGEIAQQLCVLSWKTWYSYPPHMDPTPCDQKHLKFDFKPEEICKVRMRRNDWVRRKNQIFKTYLEIFRHSTSEIIIVASYFLPGKLFRKEIAKAVDRGVKVRVVLASTSDVAIAKPAERHMYRWLLKNGIMIFEYQPFILHGKVAICDNKWLTLGSFNVNNISAFASIELNLDVKQDSFVKSAKQVVEAIIDNDCARITEEYFKSHNRLLSRIWQRMCYEFVRLLFYLFTFYFSHKE
ncbi:MAG: phosphatidylserine/phosphatidylglycerophosphate/cardiolipin synthase family protein [Chitinophagales bacterium]